MYYERNLTNAKYLLRQYIEGPDEIVLYCPRFELESKITVGKET